MKILFLTDSLSLPRHGKKDKVLYENTYPYLLKKKYPHNEFIFLGIGGATIKDIYRQSFYYLGINPDIVFIQCGIVDCAPRPFKKHETELITKLRLRFLFNPFVKLLIKYRKYQYVKPNEFNFLASKLVNQFSNNSLVYALGILPASNQYEQKLTGITESIEKYNSILKKHFNYIDNANFPEDGVLSDFHHLNKKGHLVIFEKISKIIEQQNKNS